METGVGADRPAVPVGLADRRQTEDGRSPALGCAGALHRLRCRRCGCHGAVPQARRSDLSRRRGGDFHQSGSQAGSRVLRLRDERARGSLRLPELQQPHVVQALRRHRDVDRHDRARDAERTRRHRSGLESRGGDSVGQLRGAVAPPPGRRRGVEGQCQPVGRRRAGAPHEHLVRSPEQHRRGPTCPRASASSSSWNKSIGRRPRRCVKVRMGRTSGLPSNANYDHREDPCSNERLVGGAGAAGRGGLLGPRSGVGRPQPAGHRQVQGHRTHPRAAGRDRADGPHPRRARRGGEDADGHDRARRVGHARVGPGRAARTARHAARVRPIRSRHSARS